MSNPHAALALALLDMHREFFHANLEEYSKLNDDTEMVVGKWVSACDERLGTPKVKELLLQMQLANKINSHFWNDLSSGQGKGFNHSLTDILNRNKKLANVICKFFQEALPEIQNWYNLPDNNQFQEAQLARLDALDKASNAKLVSNRNRCVDHLIELKEERDSLTAVGESVPDKLTDKISALQDSVIKEMNGDAHLNVQDKGLEQQRIDLKAPDISEPGSFLKAYKTFHICQYNADVRRKLSSHRHPVLDVLKFLTLSFLTLFAGLGLIINHRNNRKHHIEATDHRLWATTTEKFRRGICEMVDEIPSTAAQEESKALKK